MAAWAPPHECVEMAREPDSDSPRYLSDYEDSEETIRIVAAFAARAMRLVLEKAGEAAALGAQECEALDQPTRAVKLRFTALWLRERAARYAAPEATPKT